MEEVSIGARVRHKVFGEGIVFDFDDHVVHVFFRDEDREVARSFEGMEVIVPGLEVVYESEDSLDAEALAGQIREILGDMLGVEEVELGGKWDGGTLVLQPADENMKPKELPIETFFHKIVMVRDRLRVLEQSINSHKGLSDEDKVGLQQYITRVYGSLTTFNVLFQNKEDHFTGEKGGN